jgi:hypothetical protein
VYDPTLTTLTVPTTPLTAIANTSLLTCADNRFIDDSTNAFAITKIGDVLVQRFSPFSPAAAYSAGTIGGSGYFDGSGDRLDIANNTVLQLGSSNFTIEAWVYYTTVNLYAHFLGKWNTGSLEYQIYITTNNGDLLAQASSNGVAANVLTASGATRANAWNHIVWTRSGSTDTLYVNGTAVLTSTSLGAIFNGTSAVSIGGRQDNAYFMNGYVAGVRIVKGTVVYTGAFTPPTAPVTAITNTSLLLNYTNAGIIDNAMMNNLETVGNAQISTAQSKFGSGAMYFDGTGDSVKLVSNLGVIFGTGNFTIEGWIYLNTVAPLYQGIFDTRTAPDSTGCPVVIMSGANICYYTNVGFQITGSTLSINTWYFIAVTRSATSTKLFVNGIQSGSTYTDSTNYTSSSNPLVGALFDGYSLNGYIDDFRITKGVARYTANFTPPTAAFQIK